jgi:NAD(P)-dependent dehydrogenase (short-subunit alcohol dehydrogenase family)
MRNIGGANAGPASELRKTGIDVVELDVTDEASVSAAAAVVEGQVGAIDVLVNNAGTAHFGIQEAFTIEAVERQFATNVFGPLRVNRAFLPGMRAKKSGLVVYLSSVAGRVVLPFGGIYASSKFALEALAQALSYELAPFDIDVAIVEPGAYATDILGKTGGADDSERLATYGEVAAWATATPANIAKRAEGTDPGDVARVIYALATAPHGSRPMRTVVPGHPAVEAINRFIAPLQNGVAASLGIEALLPKTLA